jgi:hypothetical protein
VVVLALTLGGVVGVLLSAGYVWAEVGRFAAPQVPVTVFDERKVLAAYTVGLFVGVPLAAAYLLLEASLANGGVFGAALFLGGLVVGAEVAQLVLVRSRYWGHQPALPFYAVSLRAGIGGILALAAVAAYLGSVTVPSYPGLAAALLTAVTLVVLEVAGAFLSLRTRPSPLARTGSPLSGGLFAAVAFFLIGLGPSTGTVGALVAPLVVLGGALFAYRGRRGLLAEVPPPGAGPLRRSTDAPLPYGRTSSPGDRPGKDDGA